MLNVIEFACAGECVCTLYTVNLGLSEVCVLSVSQVTIVQYGFNVYNLKMTHAFFTHICSMWMNLCQINFRGASFDFDLVLHCSGFD